MLQCGAVCVAAYIGAHVAACVAAHVAACVAACVAVHVAAHVAACVAVARCVFPSSNTSLFDCRVRERCHV